MNMGAKGFRESEQILSALGRVLSRRKTVLVLCLLGVLAPVVYYNETTPPIYETSTSIVFEQVSSPILNDVYSNPPTELYILNRIEEINSRSFADDVAAALPDSIKTRFPMPEKLPAHFDPQQYRGGLLHKSISASLVRTSRIMRIRVQLSDPSLCVVVANLSLSVLRDRDFRIRLEGVTDLRKFVENQLERFKGQLEVSEKNLMEYKRNNNITSFDSESQEMLRKLTEAEVLYNATRANRDATEEKLAAVQRTLAAQRRELVPAVTDITSASAQRLKEKLVGLQAQYAQLVVQEYRADHPQVVRLQQDIDQTKKALADEALKLAKVSTFGDPIAQIERYINESVTLQIEVVSLRARENALKQTVDGYRRFLASLPTKELELARLVREKDANQKLYAVLLERREEIRISEARNIPDSRVIDRAQLPEEPIMPRKKLNLLMGTVLGLFVGLGMGLLLESGASRLGSIRGFEKETGCSVLALIPQMEGGPVWRTWVRGRWRGRRGSKSDLKKALVSHLAPHSAAGESYLMLRTRLESMGVGTKYSSLLVTSSGPGDGKSTTLSNLAAAFAAAGRTVLVVDAELRRPVLHAIFGIRKAPGLSDLLLARNGDGTKEPPGEVITTQAPADRGARLDRSGAVLLQPTWVDGVTLLASGKRISDPRWEMSRAEMHALLEELKKTRDIVLVDSASPILVHETSMLCGIVDAVLLVVDARSYHLHPVMETKRLLEQAGGNVVGTVVNKVDPGGAYGYYYRHYYSHESSHDDS